MKRGWGTVLWGAVVFAAVAITGVNLFYGELNQDEGWYLYAARLVSEGQWPYVNFATTQGPVMPAMYALAQPLVNAFGLLGGRLFTALLGCVTMGLCGWLAARAVARPLRGAAALMAVALLGVNIYQSYFTTIAKTYALAGLLLVAAFLCLSRLGTRRGWLWAVTGGLLVGLAAATRSSAGFAAVGVFGVLAWRAYRADGCARIDMLRRLAGFSLGGMAGLLLTFGPFLLRAPRAVWFALYDYHTGREVGSLVSALAYKAGFVARVCQAYPVALCLFGVSLVARLFLRMRPAADGDRAAHGETGEAVGLGAMLWAAIALITLVHIAAPFPYDDYQVIVYPLFCVACVRMLCRLLPRVTPGAVLSARFVTGISVALVVCCALSVAGSPRIEGWFVGKQDRIWWPLKAEAPLTRLRRVGRMILEMSEPDDALLTQDAYLAVETGLRLPAGLELGPFSYYPDWDEEKTVPLHVLGAAGMARVIAECRAPVAAFSGYGLSIRSPQVAPLAEEETEALWATVRAHYDAFVTVPDFGQAATPLQILVRKDGRSRVDLPREGVQRP